MHEDFRTHIDKRLAIELWVRRASFRSIWRRTKRKLILAIGDFRFCSKRRPSPIERRGPVRAKNRTLDALLNHLVSKREEIVRDFQAKGISGFQVDHQLLIWLAATPASPPG